MPHPEPVVDLPLWRLLKAAGARLRQLAGSPPPLSASCSPNVIPFPTGRRRRRPIRRTPQ